MLDGLAEIEEFVGRFEGRAPGTDAERRAAGYLSRRLEALGRETATEPAWVWPNFALTHVVHALVGILASIVSVENGPAGLGLAILATASAFGDLSGRFHLLRRLTGRRATQSVVSRETTDKPGTLVLVAHYDAPRGGSIFGRPAERRAALSQLVRRPIGPFDAYTAALLVVLVTAALRTVGVSGIAVSIVQFIATVLLILSVPAFADIALSSTVPGANDNASGVATVLRLTERYGGALEHFRLWVLFPGAGEGLQLGMRSWLRRHRKELDPRATIFLNVDAVGSGTIRYSTREGFLLTRTTHPRLLELCDLIAEDDEVEQRYAARRLALRSGSDAGAAAAAGFPAVSVTCRSALDHVPNARSAADTPDRVDAEALERAFGFCSELVELIDERIGPDVADTAPRRNAAAER